MTDLYLIAHKVRGEPAFDVAARMDCPECKQADGISWGCSECDGLGYWWVIPTSGHRAFPYYAQRLSELGCDISWPGEPEFEPFLKAVPSIPPDLPDHYPTRSEPKLDLAELLGFRKPKAPTEPFPRRI